MYTTAHYTKNPKTYAQVLDNIYYTWAREVHHNASLLSMYSKFQEHAWGDNPYAWEEFLEGESRRAIDILQNEIREQFGETLKLSQVGRSGATILPHEWGYESNFSGWSFSEENAGLSEIEFEHDEDSGYTVEKQRIDRAKKILAILEYMNTRIDEMKKDLPAKWVEFIKAEQEQD